jgi:hypothetical protein
MPPFNANIRNIISYKVLTKIELFKPPAKRGGGSIIGLAQL